MARPLGEISSEVLKLLQRGDFTVRQIAFKLKLSLAIARITCHRLVASGRITVKTKIKAAHSKKPVSVYALVIKQELSKLITSIFNFA